MAGKKLDVTKFAGLPWEKIKGVKPYVEEIDTCSFCNKGIKETDNYWTLMEIAHSTLEPSLTACMKCAALAGCEW